MLVEQFTEAATTARNIAALEGIARLAWRALAVGQISETDAESISVAVEAGRARLKGMGRPSSLKPPAARRRPSNRESIERRRRCALSGAVPAKMAAAFTLGELAALSIIAGEVKRRGRCELPVAAIAAMAGVCRTVVQNATREARRLGLIRLTERRHRGQASETNRIEIVAAAWRAWLRLGGRVQKRAYHEEITLFPDSADLAFPIRSCHNAPQDDEQRKRAHGSRSG